jgi:choice-of-anchor B domain-containing protein
MHRSRGRLESCGFLLLSFCLSVLISSSPAAAGVAPLQPIWAHHEDEGGGGSEPVQAPPAQGPTSCVNGFAGAYPCRNVDLLAFLPLEEMGPPATQGSDIWGWTDAQTGREYALMALSHGVTFVDVSDPTRPRWLGFLPSQTGKRSGNRDVRVYRDHAYIVADAVGPHGMQVFDLRRLRSVTTPQTFKADTVFTGVDTVHNLDIDVETGFAYLVGSDRCTGGLVVVDLQDPDNPVQAACYSAVDYIHDVQCVIYRGPDGRFSGHELCFASNVNYFTILDVTDKANIRQVARKSYSGVRYCHQGWLTEDHRHFLMDDEGDERNNHHNTRTYLWDLADLADPKNFANHTHSTRAVDHDQYIHKGFSYQGNYQAGLRILDVARVGEGRLEEVAYFDIVPDSDEATFGGAWGAYPFFASGIILVPGMQQGLYVLRRSDVAQPGQPCKAGAQTLCLAENRFRVEVDWTNPFDGSSGRALALRGTGDAAGYFAFGDPSNLEVMVKAIDDGAHWHLYYGQLTNLNISLRVIDTGTGKVSTYGNGRNNCGGIAELAPSDGHSHDSVWLGVNPSILVKPGEGIDKEASLAPIFEAGKKSSCGKKGGDAVCLLGNRYRARVTWTNQFDGSSGTAKGRALSGVTGSFAFTDPSNVELLVKVLSAEGGRTLLIWGALTNLEYTLELTDTKTGEVRTFHNPAGTYCGGLSEL